jgi:hypothetical protein
MICFMQWLNLINALSFLALSALCLLIFFKRQKAKNCSFAKYFGAIGVFYAASAVINLLWLFNASSNGLIDSIVIGSGFVMPVSAILLVALQRITGNKKMLLYLAIYAFSIFRFSTGPENLIFVLIIISALMIALFSLDISFSKTPLVKSSVFAVSYSFSIITLMLLMVKAGFPELFFIPNIFMAFSYYFLLKKIYEIEDSKCFEKKNESLFQSSLKYFIFIITLISFLYLSTISIHELGHGFSAKIVGCSSNSVIFSSLPGKSALTEVNCPNPEKYGIIALSGIALPMIFGLALLISSGRFAKRIGLIIIGLSMFISYSDFSSIGLSLNYIIVIYLFALLFILMSVAQIAESYLKSIPAPCKESDKKDKIRKEGDKKEIGRNI